MAAHTFSDLIVLQTENRELKARVAELEAQLLKMRNCVNCAVELGEAWEHPQCRGCEPGEYTNWRGKEG